MLQIRKDYLRIMFFLMATSDLCFKQVLKLYKTYKITIGLF